MSLFDKDDSRIRNAINYFNNLDDEKKAIIVSNLNPAEFKLKRHFQALFPLFSRVQKDIAVHDGIKIGNRLMDLGLEETYARLIVNNMKKHAPTLAYELSQLNKMSDSDFENIFPDVIDQVLIDNTEADVLMDKHNINHEQYDSIVGIGANLIMALLRGDTNEKETALKFADYGISSQKLEIIFNCIKERQKKIYHTMMFSNVSNIYSEVENLKAQNKIITSYMREILSLLRKNGPK